MKTMFKILMVAVMMCSAFPTISLAEDVIRVGGAGTGLGVVKILGEAFEKTHPGTRIKIQPNLGSSGGIKALLNGALDVAISGRSLKPDELKNGAAALECATTPFIFIVNNGVNKTDVTVRELEMIYNGQMLNWPDGRRIRLILRPVGDTDSTLVKRISKGMEQAVNAANARPNMIMAVTDQETADTVAKTPGALGTSTLVQHETEKSPVKLLAFNGVRPSLDSLAKGSYPLSKPFYLVTTPKTPSAAVQFIQFVRSAKGREILTQYGAMPTVEDKRIK